MDNKENYKKKIEKLQADIDRRNKEIQKERKKKELKEKVRANNLDFFFNL